MNKRQTSTEIIGHSIQIPQPLILAVETSGRTGSAAIALGKQLLTQRFFSAPMRHSAELFPAVSEMLNHFDKKPDEIEHIYISAGPGSFTGLRIAVTMAKIMHLANAVKIVAVDTMDVLAANAVDCIKDKKIEAEKIATVLDAKRGQFFVAVYQFHTGISLNTQHCLEKIVPDCLMTTAEFLDRFADPKQIVRLLGEGLVYYKDKFNADNVRFFDETYWYPKAEKVHLLGWQMALAGQFADALALQPNYLLRPEIGIKKKA
jgi:tRNA threonylcarbamoyl adenosine modification protein YeaZ